MRLILERGGDAGGSSKGFGFVEFYNKAAAEAARKKLSSPEYRIRGNSLQARCATGPSRARNLWQCPLLLPIILSNYAAGALGRGQEGEREP